MLKTSDILIINYSPNTLWKALELHKYVFKYNYTTKILDTSDSMIDIDKIIEIIEINSPKLICFNIFTSSIYHLPIISSVSRNICTKVDEATIAFGVTPADLRDVGIRDAAFDFLCKDNESLLNIMKFVGDKDVASEFKNDVWFKDEERYKSSL